MSVSGTLLLCKKERSIRKKSDHLGKNKYRKDKPETNEIGGIGVKRMGDGNGIKRWRGSHFSECSFIMVLTFKTNLEIKERKEGRNH